MEIAIDTYELDYASYYDARKGVSYQDMIPPKPKYFKVFKIFSFIIAAIALLLGLLNIIFSVRVMLSQASIETGAVAGMYFLYGSLAAYFGAKDLVSCINTKSGKTADIKGQTA